MQCNERLIMTEAEQTPTTDSALQNEKWDIEPSQAVKDLVRHAFFFEQAAALYIISEFTRPAGRDEVATVIDDIAQEYGTEFLQAGAFEEAPFSHLRVFVWAMSALQIMADANGFATYASGREEELKDLLPESQLLTATGIDLGELSAGLMSQNVNYDDPEAKDAFTELISHLGMALLTATEINVSMGLEEFALFDYVPDEDFLALDRYQQYLTVTGLGEFEGMVEALPNLTAIYCDLVEKTLSVKVNDYLMRRARFAAQYVSKHRAEFDKPTAVHADAGSEAPGEQSQRFNINKIWNRWSREIRQTDWSVIDGDVFWREYARWSANEYLDVVVPDGSDPRKTDGFVIGAHSREKRAVGLLGYVKTPASMEKKKFPRLGGEGQVF